MTTVNLKGTSNSTLQIEKGGVVLANSSGNLAIRNTTNTADAQITTSKLNNSGDSIDINSDAIDSGNDYKLTIARSASQTASWTLTLPTTAGSNGQVLTTNGSGVTSWASGGGGGISQDDAIKLMWIMR
jgi:hypothetical protein